MVRRGGRGRSGCARLRSRRRHPASECRGRGHHVDSVDRKPDRKELVGAFMRGELTSCRPAPGPGRKPETPRRLHARAPLWVRGAGRAAGQRSGRSSRRPIRQASCPRSGAEEEAAVRGRGRGDAAGTQSRPAPPGASGASHTEPGTVSSSSGLAAPPRPLLAHSYLGLFSALFLVTGISLDDSCATRGHSAAPSFSAWNLFDRPCGPVSGSSRPLPSWPRSPDPVPRGRCPLCGCEPRNV